MNYFKIATLKPYDKNPRKHSKRHIAEVARSIEEFGFTSLILIDENNEILAGHGRYLASKELSSPILGYHFHTYKN